MVLELMPTELENKYGLKFGTDKVAQGYLPTYYEIIDGFDAAPSICELGVYLGGSLEMWAKFFPNGIIAGVDNREKSNWPPGTHKIVSDQTSMDLPGKLQEISPDGWDLIVDDCSHLGTLTMQSWVNLWPLVKPGAYYVIEDWYRGLGENRLVRTESAGGNANSMFLTAQTFLRIFGSRENPYDLESATYKYGLIVLRKAKAAG